MVEHELPLPVYQAILSRRRKVLILPSSSGRFQRHDAIRVLEVLNGERTGIWCFARVMWSEMTEDREWSVLSIEPVTPTMPGLGPVVPSDDAPTQPELPKVRRP